MPTPRLNSKIRKEQIAHAALSLISSQGVAAMTVQRTANMVGLGPSALYRHFKNKAEIINAALGLLQKHALEDFDLSMQEAADPLDALHKLLMRRVRHTMEHRSLPRLFFSEEINYRYPDLKAKIYQILNGFIHGIMDIVSRGQDQGVIRTDITDQQVAVMFIGLFQPADFLYELSGGQFDLVTHTHKVWTVFRQSVKGPGPK